MVGSVEGKTFDEVGRGDDGAMEEESNGEKCTGVRQRRGDVDEIEDERFAKYDEDGEDDEDDEEDGCCEPGENDESENARENDEGDCDIIGEEYGDEEDGDSIFVVTERERYKKLKLLHLKKIKTTFSRNIKDKKKQ